MASGCGAIRRRAIGPRHSCAVHEPSKYVADGLEAGWIGIDTLSSVLAEAPFGGMKDSSFGYEGGPEGFDAYCQTKTVGQASMDG